MGIGRSTGQRRASGARAGRSRGAAGERGEGERKVMTGGPGSSEREAGCWASVSGAGQGERVTCSVGAARRELGRGGKKAAVERWGALG